MDRREAIKLFGIGVAATAVAGTSATADEKKSESKDVLMLVYPKFTALDLVGPHHVFSLLEGYKVRLVWKDTKEVVSDTGIPIRPTAAFDDCPEDPAVIFVPGGTEGTLAAMEDKDVRAFLTGRVRRPSTSPAFVPGRWCWALRACSRATRPPRTG